MELESGTTSGREVRMRKAKAVLWHKNRMGPYTLLFRLRNVVTAESGWQPDVLGGSEVQREDLQDARLRAQGRVLPPEHPVTA